MTKIAVNNSVGDFCFSISIETILWLYENKSPYVKVYTHADMYNKHVTECQMLKKEPIANLEEFIKNQIGEYNSHLIENRIGKFFYGGPIFSKDYNYFLEFDDSIPRNDPLLIKCVEELNEKSWNEMPGGEKPSIKIIEIPDNVDWIIVSHDDGTEHVAEKHRTWY